MKDFISDASLSESQEVSRGAETHNTFTTSSRSWVSLRSGRGSITPDSKATGKNLRTAMDELPSGR